MDFSHEIIWGLFERTLSNNRHNKNPWVDFICELEKIKPKPYWSDLKNIDCSSPSSTLIFDLNNYFTDNLLDSNVISLWFGIAKLFDENNNKEFYELYVIGCDSYDENDAEWACEPTFEPEDKYFGIDEVNYIDKYIKEDNEDYSILDWVLPMAFLAFIIDKIIIDKKLKSLNNKVLNATIGYDGGDFINLTQIKN